MQGKRLVTRQGHKVANIPRVPGRILYLRLQAKALSAPLRGRWLALRPCEPDNLQATSSRGTKNSHFQNV